MDEKKFDIKKLLYPALIVLLVIMFVGGVIIGAVTILANEGSRERYTAAESVSPYPETGEELIALVNDYIENAVSSKPLTAMEYGCSLDSDSFICESENSSVKTVFEKSADSISSLIKDKYYTSHESEINAANTEYFDDISSFVKAINLDASDITEYKIDYEYGWCSACETEFEIFEEFGNCPNCNSEGTLSNRMRDNYSVTINIKPDSSALSSNSFACGEFSQEAYDEAAEGFCKVEDYSGEIKELIIYAEMSRLKNEIYSIEFKTVSNEICDVAFDENYSYLANDKLSFDKNEWIKFSFTYPSLSLSANEMVLEPKGTDNLVATLTCDDPASYKASWSSDNPDMVSVDDEGYLKAGKETGEATITATFEFGGNTYTDTCLVKVAVSAEKVDLNKGKLKLSVGDTYTLEAEVSPSDTTDKSVDWFSEDESIAKVDENGVVTAVSKGTTTVYILTTDGDFYSSCEVEVK